MSVRSFVKSVADGLAPRAMHNRYIRVYTPKEPEIALLAAICGEGAVAVDAGAHLGLYAHHLLGLGKQVVAFEPLPSMQASLRRHYGARIRLEAVALSDVEGSAELRFPDGDFPLATIERSNELRVAKSSRILVHRTPLRSLDSYRLEDVGFLKIDVEGHEEAVLRGAMETLRRSLPGLLIEIEERHNPGALARVPARLGGLGYAGFFLADGALQDMATFCAERDQSSANVGAAGKLGRYINNFIFVPQTRAQVLQADVAAILAQRTAA